MLPTIRTVRYCYYCMYRTLADMKPLGRRPDGGFILQDKLAQFHSPFFHDTLHTPSPHPSVLYTYMRRNGKICPPGGKMRLLPQLLDKDELA